MNEPTPYTGDVVIGGPSAVRRLPGVTIRKASVSEMDNNAYVITCQKTGAQLLVDAAANPDRLLRLLGEGSPTNRLDMIVTTHRHADHHRALSSVVAVTGARTAAGADDADHLPLAPDLRLRHGDVITVGELKFAVIALRGHTPGSVALALHEPENRDLVHIFTGDSLFPGGVGRTETPENFKSLYHDVTTRIFDVYHDAWVYPGHGADTTLATERPALGEWLERGW